MQNVITGSVGSSDVGEKFSSDERCPSWKIQTIAPNEALVERKFISTALSGRRTEPRRRNSTRYVAMTTKRPATGGLQRMKLIASTRDAWTPASAGAATRGGPVP